MTLREALAAQHRLVCVVGADLHGVRTIAGARAAYLRDEIDVTEFERRVTLLLNGKSVAASRPCRICSAARDRAKHDIYASRHVGLDHPR